MHPQCNEICAAMTSFDDYHGSKVSVKDLLFTSAQHFKENVLANPQS